MSHLTDSLDVGSGPYLSWGKTQHLVAEGHMSISHCFRLANLDYSCLIYRKMFYMNWTLFREKKNVKCSNRNVLVRSTLCRFG